MGSKVYIGVRGSEEWIKCPSPRTDFSSSSWSNLVQQRNGRVTGRRSRQTHKTYELAWNTAPTSDARKIKAWYYGVSSADPNELIWWLDPTIKNAVPPHWSSPAIGGTDGTPIFGTSRPDLEDTPANTYGLPKKMAVFTGNGTTNNNSPHLYIPVPPGWVAHIDVRGMPAGAGMVAQLRDGRTAMGSPTVVPISSVTNATKYLTKVTGISDASGISLRFPLGETISSTTYPTTVRVASIMVEVLPPGQTPKWEGFVIGEGANGCRMFDPVTEAPISAVYDRTSISATLTEVG